MNIEELRYGEDCPEKFGLEECAPDAAQSHRKRINILSHAVRISDSLFPELGKSVKAVRENLCPRHRPEFYVTGESGLQAVCITLDNDVDFAVVLHSGIVNLLNGGELSFIIGHEIGHYLFRHGHYDRPSGLSELAFMHWQRAAEVSADRAGFVCAPSEQDGISAMIKIASGLGHPHFKFHAQSYMKQAKEIIEAGHSGTMRFSHPTLPLRTRALHWFAMSEPYHRWRKSGKHAPISKDELDSRIRSDFERAEGGGMRAVSNKTIKRALLWYLLDFSLNDNILTKTEQSALGIFAGDKEARQAVEFVRSHGTVQKAKHAVREKRKSALDDVKQLPPADKKIFESDLQAALTLIQTPQKSKNE